MLGDAIEKFVMRHSKVAATVFKQLVELVIYPFESTRMSVRFDGTTLYKPLFSGALFRIIFFRCHSFDRG